MSLVNRSWPKSKAMVSRPLPESTIKELIRSIAILPMAVVNLFAPVSGLVTASDASEAGGGLCATAGLTEEGEMVLRAITARGSNREDVAFAPAGSVPTVLGRGGPRVFIISLFDGIGAMIVALTRLKCQVVGYASCEIDKACKRLTKTRWPGIIELGDITKVDRKVVQALSNSVGYKIDLVIIGAGSPCQDLSSLNATRTGLAGQKSKLFYEVPRVIGLVKEEFQVPVESFVENVASMTPENVREFSKVLQAEAVLLDARHFCHCRRPRFFWPSWEITPQQEEVLQREKDWQHWIFPDVRGCPSEWLEAGCSWASSTQLFPTFTRQKRSSPPYQPAGIATASPAAIQRWKEDSYFVQVYNYEAVNMITTTNNCLRLPTLAEKEVIMGFDVGYISKSFNDKVTPETKELIGGQMIGNTFNVYVTMMLLHECLRHHGGEPERDVRQLISKKQVSPDGWAKFPKFVKGAVETPKVEGLVKHVLRHGEKGGTDVRLDLNIPYRLKAWPRSGIRSHLFHWAIVHGYSWKNHAHINGLELQAVLNSIKWRLRKATRSGHRILHLVDSQVVAAIMAKGRTSSFRLQLALSKLSALVVASGTVVAVAYVDTRDNPADIPSRWSELKALLNKHKGKPKDPHKP
eukprot:s868_g22.t1